MMPSTLHVATPAKLQIRTPVDDHAADRVATRRLSFPVGGGHRDRTDPGAAQKGHRWAGLKQLTGYPRVHHQARLVHPHEQRKPSPTHTTPTQPLNHPIVGSRTTTVSSLLCSPSKAERYVIYSYLEGHMAQGTEVLNVDLVGG
jgi:hypothetical protein